MAAASFTTTTSVEGSSTAPVPNSLSAREITTEYHPTTETMDPATTAKKKKTGKSS